MGRKHGILSRHSQLNNDIENSTSIKNAFKIFEKTENSAKDMTFGSHYTELRSVGKIALGRKNYLFCKNDNATENAAIIYTIIGCCKVAGSDFRQWTSYFLNRIHEYYSDYSRPQDDFLPATLKERGLV